MGGAPAWIAIGLMLGLTGAMAVYHGALGYVVARWLPATGALRWLVAVPAAWVFVEWWRGSVFVGIHVAVARLLADRRLAALARADHRDVRHQRAAAAQCWRARYASAWNMRSRVIAVAVLVVPWVASALACERRMDQTRPVPQSASRSCRARFRRTKNGSRETSRKSLASIAS